MESIKLFDMLDTLFLYKTKSSKQEIQFLRETGVYDLDNEKITFSSMNLTEEKIWYIKILQLQKIVNGHPNILRLILVSNPSSSEESEWATFSPSTAASSFLSEKTNRKEGWAGKM